MQRLQLLLQFEKEWFANRKWWFKPTDDDDQYITKNFASLLEIKPIYEDHVFSALPVRIRVAFVVVNDQLPRHVYRDHPEYDRLVADRLVHAIRYADWLKPYYAALSSEHLCFVLIPYRHTHDYDRVIGAIEEAWAYLKRRPYDSIIKRFLKAAYARAPQDQTKRIIAYRPHTQTTTIDPAIFLTDFDDVLCSTCITTLKSKRYHSHPPLKQHKIFKIVQSSLSSIPNQSNIIMSLSGGVDSMILCYILHNICPNKITAVHVDYRNRPTSRREAELVAIWCDMLGLKCVMRIITEINRPECMEYGLRSTYEDYTRKVRYNTYKAATASTADSADSQGNPGNPGSPFVCLGHNFNDSFENIMTNIVHKTKYDNLVGMDNLATTDGIQFWRPLLGVTKEDIYKFAATYRIPYVYDSTVEWSQRGKIRDSVYPAIHKWNPEFFNNFFTMSQHLSSMHKMLQSLVDKYIAETVVQEQVSTTLTLTKQELEPLLTPLFWRQYIYKIYNVHPSHASMANYIERLRALINKHDSIRTTIILAKTLSAEIRIKRSIVTLTIRQLVDPST